MAGDELEVVESYRNSLEDLTFNSKPLISMLTMLAEDSIQFAEEIVKAIEEQIKKVAVNRKLPILYLIDSVMKNLADTLYPKLFEQCIVQIFSRVFEEVDEKTRQSMYKLRQTWVDIISNKRLYALDMSVSRIDKAWPVTAKPPEQGVIHVNPKFLKAQQHLAEGDEELSAKEKEKIRLDKQLAVARAKLEQSKKELERPTVPSKVSKKMIDREPPSMIALPPAGKSVPNPVRTDPRLNRDPRMVNRDPRIKKDATPEKEPVPVPQSTLSPKRLDLATLLSNLSAVATKVTEVQAKRKSSIETDSEKMPEMPPVSSTKPTSFRVKDTEWEITMSKRGPSPNKSTADSDDRTDAKTTEIKHVRKEIRKPMSVKIKAKEQKPLKSALKRIKEEPVQQSSKSVKQSKDMADKLLKGGSEVQIKEETSQDKGNSKQRIPLKPKARVGQKQKQSKIEIKIEKETEKISSKSKVEAVKQPSKNNSKQQKGKKSIKAVSKSTKKEIEENEDESIKEECVLEESSKVKKGRKVKEMERKSVLDTGRVSPRAAFYKSPLDKRRALSFRAGKAHRERLIERRKNRLSQDANHQGVDVKNLKNDDMEIDNEQPLIREAVDVDMRVGMRAPPGIVRRQEPKKYVEENTNIPKRTASDSSETSHVDEPVNKRMRTTAPNQDISQLFGAEDVDYRSLSAPRMAPPPMPSSVLLSTPVKSNTQRGWNKFKEEHPDEFVQENERKRIRDAQMQDVQDEDLRQQSSGASMMQPYPSPKDIKYVDKDRILKQAEMELKEGRMGKEDYQQVLHQVGQVYNRSVHDPRIRGSRDSGRISESPDGVSPPTGMYRRPEEQLSGQSSERSPAYQERNQGSKNFQRKENEHSKEDYDRRGSFEDQYSKSRFMGEDEGPSNYGDMEGNNRFRHKRSRSPPEGYSPRDVDNSQSSFDGISTSQNKRLIRDRSWEQEIESRSPHMYEEEDTDFRTHAPMDSIRRPIRNNELLDNGPRHRGPAPVSRGMPGPRPQQPRPQQPRPQQPRLLPQGPQPRPQLHQPTSERLLPQPTSERLLPQPNSERLLPQQNSERLLPPRPHNLNQPRPPVVGPVVPPVDVAVSAPPRAVPTTQAPMRPMPQVPTRPPVPVPMKPLPADEIMGDPMDDPRWSAMKGLLDRNETEEVVLDDKPFELRMGTSRKLRLYNQDFDVRVDLEQKGIFINGNLVYKLGEPIKEVNINERLVRLYYHGLPKPIWLGGQYYEMRIDAPPRNVMINGFQRGFQIDGRDMMILIDRIEKGQYGGPPRKIKIGGVEHEMRFQFPPRTILIDGKPCELKLDSKIPFVVINGKPHGIRFDGEPKTVFINDQPYLIPLDRAEKIRIGNRPTYVAFGGPAHEIIIDGKWFEVKFDNTPKDIHLGNRLLKIRIPGPLPKVKILNELRVNFDVSRLFIKDSAEVKRDLQSTLSNPRVQPSVGANMLPVPGIPQVPLHPNQPLQPPIINSGVRFPPVPLPIQQPPVVPSSVNQSLIQQGVNLLLQGMGQQTGQPAVSMPQPGLPSLPELIKQINNRAQPPVPRMPIMPQLPPMTSIAQQPPIVSMPVVPGSFPLLAQLSSAQQTSSMAPAITTSLPGTITSSTSSAPPKAPVDINSLLNNLLKVGLIKKDAAEEESSSSVQEASSRGTESSSGPVVPAVVKKEKKKDIIPDLSDFDADLLKIHYKSVVEALHEGIQCHTCSARFTSEEHEKYRAHLDWHFRQNKQEQETVKVAKNRKWFYTIADWIQYEELEDLEEKSRSEIFEQMRSGLQKENASATFDPLKLRALEGMEVINNPVASGVEEEDICATCGDPFDQLWNEETEEWILKNAVKSKGKTYHPICFEDLQETPTPAVDVVSNPLEGEIASQEKEKVDQAVKPDETPTDQLDSSASDGISDIKMEVGNVVIKSEQEPINAESSESSGLLSNMKTETEGLLESSSRVVDGSNAVFQSVLTGAMETDSGIPGLSVQPDTKSLPGVSNELDHNSTPSLSTQPDTNSVPGLSNGPNNNSVHGLSTQPDSPAKMEVSDLKGEYLQSESDDLKPLPTFVSALTNPVTTGQVISVCPEDPNSPWEMDSNPTPELSRTPSPVLESTVMSAADPLEQNVGPTESYST